MSTGSLRYTLVSFLGRHVPLFAMYYRRHPRFGRLVVRPDSEIVIEGYPRCANSFSVLAFERAQQRPMHIGHHLHAPAQIALGVKYGIPVLALIREPIGAAASLITRHPEITAAQALGQYVSFYECVKRYGDRVVLADFRKITSDYAEVIEAVNRRFNTAFKPYVNSAEEDETVFREIDSLNSENEGGAENQLARPSDAKNALLQAARWHVEQEPLAARAREVFNQLSAVCV
jgi:hypothetical protein